MPDFLTNNIIAITFGVTTLVTSLVALYYRRLEHRQEVEELLEDGRRAGLFLSREAMIAYLLKMYGKAESGDVIWAQCVRCTDFTQAVRGKILEAAGRGVHFQMLTNQHSPAVAEFRALFDPLENAQIVELPDNEISLQGLSDQEVVITFPGVASYTAVLVRDATFVKIMRTWFEHRFVIGLAEKSYSTRV